MAEVAKRRPGRPAKSPEGPKRANLKIRIHERTRAALETEAERNHRSLSEEAEARLEQSLQASGLVDEAFDLAFGRQCAAVVLMLADLMRVASSHAAFKKTHTLAGVSGWVDVPYAFDMAKEAVDAVFEALYPEGDREAPKDGKIPGGPDFDELNKHLGAAFATGLLRAVAGEASTPEQDHLAQKVRERLSPDAIERIREWVNHGKRAHPPARSEHLGNQI